MRVLSGGARCTPVRGEPDEWGCLSRGLILGRTGPRREVSVMKVQRVRVGFHSVPRDLDRIRVLPSPSWVRHLFVTVSYRSVPRDFSVSSGLAVGESRRLLSLSPSRRLSGASTSRTHCPAPSHHSSGRVCGGGPAVPVRASTAGARVSARTPVRPESPTSSGRGRAGRGVCGSRRE